MTEQNDDEHQVTVLSPWQELVYKENAKVVAVFWEWRHKGMTYFSAGVTALVALSSWLYKQDGFLRRASFIPLAAGAGFSLISLLLDRRNARILKECYAVGARIEEQINGKSTDGPSIFTHIQKGQRSWPSYTRGLTIFYVGAAVLLVAAAIILFNTA